MILQKYYELLLKKHIHFVLLSCLKQLNWFFDEDLHLSVINSFCNIIHYATQYHFFGGGGGIIQINTLDALNW